MKTLVLMVMAGVAVGMSGCSLRDEAPIAASAPADGQKVRPASTPALEQKANPASEPAHEQKVALASAPAHEQRADPASGPADEQKVDLTPKFKQGDVYSFKQHIVRSETKVVGNIPKAEDAEAAKPADAPDGKKDDGKKDDAKKDDAKPEPKKDEAKKDEPKKEVVQMLKQSWSIDQTATYEVRVMTVGEPGITLEVELKALTATADLPGGKASWNSDQPADDKDMTNPLIMTYKPALNTVMKIYLGADGNVTLVQPDPRVSLNIRGTLAPMIQLMFSPDMAKARWGPILWPKDGREPAVVGKSWKNVEEVPHAALGRFVYTTTNTLKGVKDNLAQIDIAGELGLVPGDPSKTQQGTLTEQSVKGSAVFDVKAGLIKSHSWMEKSHLNVNAQGLEVKFDKDLTCTTTRE